MCVHRLGSSSVLQLHTMDLDDAASKFSIFQMRLLNQGPQFWQAGLWLAARNRQNDETALNSSQWFWWLLLVFSYIPSPLNGISHEQVAFIFTSLIPSLSFICHFNQKSGPAAPLAAESVSLDHIRFSVKYFLAPSHAALCASEEFTNLHATTSPF